ncbi:MAG: tryptophan synthase subunit alpha [Desulfobacterales bacterium]|nr:tryptophan synthase subunit alpha [Desulfobacterales bacterium]
MNRIEQTFIKLNQKREKALVGFITAGDPDIQTSLAIILEMCKAGLDILELGIPFSDPTSDGPVIQRSSLRALNKGANLSTIFELCATVRKHYDVPIVLFSYYNPMFVYGITPFYHEAIQSGADGVLIVDLPPEESGELTQGWPDDKLSIIRLVAPTTPNERMTQIVSAASGFIYLVSKTGVTGSDGLQTSVIEQNVIKLKSLTQLPICVGFGISTVEQVRQVSELADGIVIGSAFERLIETNLDDPNLPKLIGDQTAEFKKATLA